MKRNLIDMFVTVAAVLLLFGCSGGSSGDSGSTAVPLAPTPSISTQGSLDFGVAVLGSTSSRQLLISNVGTGTLDIGQLSLPANSPFVITTDNCSNHSVESQATCSTTLKLTPNDQVNYSDTLTIPSNDTTRNPLALALTGKGRAYNLKINEVKTDGCGSNVLRVLVSVADAAGAPIGGIAFADFTITENGVAKPVDAANSVHPILTPVSVDLLLDYSGSVSAGDLASIEAGAKSFVAQLNAQDEAGVLKFALTIGAKTAFTPDKPTLNTAIDAAYPGDTGGTILYDSLITAIDDTAARASTNRRAIIVFSDGFDEESTSTLQDVIDHAILRGIPIFAIAYINATNPQPAIMQQLAQETGGEYFLAPTAGDVAGIYNQISQILSLQYLLEYDTSSSGGTTVSLDVEVDNGGQLGGDSKEATGC